MPERFARRRLDDREVWLDFRDGRLLSLNPTATAILEAWREGLREPGALADRLVARFDVSRADALAAVETFLADASRLGLTEA